MHFPSLFLFNAVILNVLLCAIFTTLTVQFWQDLKRQPNRATRAITIFFASLSASTGWTAVYTAQVFFGIDNYPVNAVILFGRDVFLTALLASTIYLIVELKYGHH